jgi:hypothetical protein
LGPPGDVLAVPVLPEPVLPDVPMLPDEPVLPEVPMLPEEPMLFDDPIPPDELAAPEPIALPVVPLAELRLPVLPPFPSAVTAVSESGLTIIITGCPSLSFARTRNDSGMTLTSVKPDCSSSDFIRAATGLLCPAMLVEGPLMLVDEVPVADEDGDCNAPEPVGPVVADPILAPAFGCVLLEVCAAAGSAKARATAAPATTSDFMWTFSLAPRGAFPEPGTFRRVPVLRVSWLPLGGHTWGIFG